MVVVRVEGGTSNRKRCGVGGSVLVWNLYNEPWMFGSGDKETESEC